MVYSQLIAPTSSVSAHIAQYKTGFSCFHSCFQIAHVIREIRHFQQTPYKIEYNARVASYLLDPSLLLSDDNLYRLSLDLEPRRSTLTHVTVPLLANVTSSASSSSSSS